MEFLLQFLQEGYWIIVILVAIVCEVIKSKFTDNIKGFMPMIAVTLGILFSIAHGGLILQMGFEPVALLMNIEQGIIAGALSTLGFDVLQGILKMTTNKKI